MDHMVLVHPEWKPFLRYMAVTDESLAFERIRNEWIGLYKENALDLSVKLEQFICNWIPERFYRRRVQLAGGPSQEGNGFAIWRRLHKDHVGEGLDHEYAGTSCLREFPRCNKLADLPAHLDGFYELFDKFGGELEGCHMHTRGMLLDIIPKELEEKILKKKELASLNHRQLAAWCRSRCLIEKTKQLADQTRKHYMHKVEKGKVHQLSQLGMAAQNSPLPDADPDLDEAPPYAKAMKGQIAQLTQLVTAITPPPGKSKWCPTRT